MACLCAAAVCIISRVYAPCGPVYRRILLTRSLNNKKNTAPLTLDQVLVGQWRSLFQFPQNNKVATMRLKNTLVFRPWAHKWAQMHLLFKQRGTGRENDNCVGLKLAKNTCVTPSAALRQMYDRA